MPLRHPPLIATVASLCLIARAVAAPPECTARGQVDVAKIEQQVILIGEVHGTSELPRFTCELVCSLLKVGRSVILDAEQDGDEQDGLNRYLRSAGTASDRRILLRGRTWGTYADGRGSAAMFELVESMRGLRQSDKLTASLPARAPAGTP